MRWCMRQSAKGGRVCAFIQQYYYIYCNDKLKCLSEESKTKSLKVINVIEEDSKYEHYHEKVVEKEYLENFDDYRNAGEKET